MTNASFVYKLIFFVDIIVDKWYICFSDRVTEACVACDLNRLLREPITFGRITNDNNRGIGDTNEAIISVGSGIWTLS